ncbi:ABC transporter permease [Burkholderia gladioli]|uniref:Inner-membrane translocator n=1 Tax=Burkholderia gladioli (strain BSR3) TaxID=999541 RepID=F2L9S2_BURGS|nr:ABC transporter permease [Burkholderia gladioli]AEA60069.1 inner-membrane translocator [Burkholderia gladioli BSR3]MBW5286353.1 ABC transporter permease [Burkholderia gladioli]
MNTVPRKMPRAPGGRHWLSAWIATALVLVTTALFNAGKGGPSLGPLLSTALSFSTFTVLVSLGQMLVITSGPGNIDLSIPSVIALSGALSMSVMNGANGMILPGIAVALLSGAVVGGFNFVLIRFLRIPPIIATLSSALIVLSCAIAYGRGVRTPPPALLAQMMVARIAWLPLFSIFAIALTLLVWLLLTRTLYGRALAALGQNTNAARLAGVRTDFHVWLTYVICGALAGLTGCLIATFSGGNSLDQGNEYLLLTVAVVVIGGTSVSGGRASLGGVWGAALFMFLLVALLNSAGASAGLRTVLTGIIIVAVVALTEKRKSF